MIPTKCIGRPYTHIPSDDGSEGLDVGLDHLLLGWLGVGGELHDDEPVLVVAAVEEDRLLGRAVAPVRRGVVQRRVPGPTGRRGLGPARREQRPRGEVGGGSCGGERGEAAGERAGGGGEEERGEAAAGGGCGRHGWGAARDSGRSAGADGGEGRRRGEGERRGAEWAAM